MKFTTENSWFAVLIIQSWIKSMIRVLLLKSSTYISEKVSVGSSSTSLGPDDWARVKKIVNGVNRISFVFAKKRKCLMEALIVHDTLKRIGILSTIRLGAITSDETIKAHDKAIEEKEILSREIIADAVPSRAGVAVGAGSGGAGGAFIPVGGEGNSLSGCNLSIT